MKLRYLFFALFALIVLHVSAQSDYSSYLSQAWECVNSGNCDAAQRSYNVYKELTSNRVAAIEDAIAKCSQQSKSSTRGVYNIGDDATDLVHERGYKIAYLNADGTHGFAIQIGPYSREPKKYGYSTIEELKKMYPNRAKLGLNEEFWSATPVPGTETLFRYAKYYTFDFYSGTTNQHRDPNKEERGKVSLRTMRILKF